jgi:gluconokinase
MLLALDIGTSSARAALYDAAGAAVPGRFHRIAYEPRVTPDGGVEHDAERLLAAVAACIDATLAGGGEVRAVAVTTFWHGLLGFDDAGRPATPVYMWADTRSSADADALRARVDEDALHARTGCHLHASYWPARLAWLRRTAPDVVARVARWGSFGEHLERRLLGDAATSLSMASGTGLFDQDALAWDDEALRLAGVDRERLFPLRDRAEARAGLARAWAARWPALRGVPWLPAVGDGAASNVGSGCVSPARLALNLGTSAALRVVPAPGTPPATAPPPRGLWRYRLDRRRVIVGGATSEGGTVDAWCREVLRLPDEAATEAALAAMAPDAHGLTVLPFLAGERAPGWRGDRRATIAGLGLDTGPLDVLRAALEAVALRLALVYDLLRPWAAAEHAIVASGGAAASAAWAQILADALGHPLTLALDDEATSRGAALLALDALGERALDAGPPPPTAGRVVAPDAARHARYRAALERQRRFDERV